MHSQTCCQLQNTCQMLHTLLTPLCPPKQSSTSSMIQTDVSAAHLDLRLHLSWICGDGT
jgi:hypothetical protein